MEERAAVFEYGICASGARSSDRQQLQIGSMGLEWITARRRRSDKEVVERKKVVNPDTGETPAGYNKMLRDCARIALAAASAALLGGWPQIALVASAIAAGLLQQGTTYSIKNWKWTAGRGVSSRHVSRPGFCGPPREWSTRTAATPSTCLLYTSPSPRD